jgi:hypothetical protein
VNLPDPVSLVRQYVRVACLSDLSEVFDHLFAFFDRHDTADAVETFQLRMASILKPFFDHKPVPIFDPSIWKNAPPTNVYGLACSLFGSLITVKSKQPIDKKQIDSLHEGWVKIFLFWACLKRAGFSFSIAPAHPLLKAIAQFFLSIHHPFLSLSSFPSKPLDPFLFDPARSIAEVSEAIAQHLDLAFDELDDFLRHNSDRKTDKRDDLARVVGKRSPDIEALLNFLSPQHSSAVGPASLVFLRPYHSANVYKAEDGILRHLIDVGGTVIVNLADRSESASPKIKQFFSARICKKLFTALSDRFVKPNGSAEADDLFNVLVVIEEAQEVVPPSAQEEGIYKKMALMGRKLGLGVAFATQSPTNIDADLLKQASLAFVLHLPSSSEMAFLVQNQPDIGLIGNRAEIWSRPGQGDFWRKGGLVLPLRCDPFPLNDLLGKATAAAITPTK